MRLGRWFRAISVAVVEGMLAGIGLILVAGQAYAMTDLKAPESGVAKIAGLPGMVAEAARSATSLTALALGLGTIGVLLLWPRIPYVGRVLPAPLAAVGLATGVSLMLGTPTATVQVSGLADAVHLVGFDDLGVLARPGVVGVVVAFALIASAESLFSAAAVDRLHNGPRTQYDKELVAQGVGNTVCGVLGALPMTAVIVRSAANVSAGARTRLARVLHGVWLLVFAALVPAALGVIPVAALAGVLVHAGVKLIPVKEIAELWREHRGEVVILVATAASIVAISMFEGVLIGLGLAIVKTAWEASHVRVEVVDQVAGPIGVHVSGNATFLRLPRILDELEALPHDRPVDLDLSGLHHLDHACRAALTGWSEQRNAATGPPVRLLGAGI